jgi:hypothetical protein
MDAATIQRISFALKGKADFTYLTADMEINGADFPYTETYVDIGFSFFTLQFKLFTNDDSGSKNVSYNPFASFSIPLMTIADLSSNKNINTSSSSHLSTDG